VSHALLYMRESPSSDQVLPEDGAQRLGSGKKFYIFLVERRFDLGEELTDVVHKNHIKQCFDDFISAKIVELL